MRYLIKNKLFVLSVLGLTVLYWVSRLTNLIILPIFTDEAIYVRWGQLGVGDASFRLYSLVDGKQPLLIWLFLPALKYISDPLVAGRFVSVVLGFFGMMGLGVLGWVITRSKRVGLIVSFMYLTSPFFLTYDRLALYESLLVMLTVWSLVFTVLLARTRRLDTALILGMINGAGLLTKSSASFFLYLLPLSLFFTHWKKGEKVTILTRWIPLVLIVVVLAVSATFVMRLSPLYHTVGQKNLTFIYSLSELWEDPFKSVFGNIRGLGGWVIGYMTVPLFALLIPSFWWGFKKEKYTALFLVSWFAIPFIALATFGRVIYPRFTLFMIPTLYVLLAWYLSSISRKNISKALFAGVFLLFFGNALYFDYHVLFDPIKAPYPYADRQQFINDWPSGYGVAEAIDLFRQKAKSGKIVVGTEGTFGLFPYAFELYLGHDKNVEFRAYWPVNSTLPPDLLEAAKTYPTYLVYKETQIIPSHLPLKLVLEKRRGDGDTFFRVYKVENSVN